LKTIKFEIITYQATIFFISQSPEVSEDSCTLAFLQQNSHVSMLNCFLFSLRACISVSICWLLLVNSLQYRRGINFVFDISLSTRQRRPTAGFSCNQIFNWWFNSL